ncbi:MULTISPECIES: copper resistance protein CopC [unclassified Arthrobacter]|uniref:copper resistance CopC family protein n=1 Tax=unclassified Arthrobacter TaxID=235627 RepID=UPI001490C422|nr:MULTISPECIES: copper resistance CopC family protein [unclassified Arthrobacter]MBE0008323.1 copper resistance protein CopC [Arthrobacter sp. AET 35A]NOJ62062.1 copper resistance protein CopC [Arthrobacter sp. 147(2020)]
MSSTNSRSARAAASNVFVRVPALLAAMLLVVLMTALGSASTANAHDELVGSNPEDGASVEQLPEAIELTFSNVPSGIGSEVEVLDQTGGNWADGDVAIVDRVASQPLRAGAPAGEYTVNWRVVSSDSHPIEGTFTFTFTAAAAGTAQSPSAAVGTQGPIEIEEAEQTAQGDFPWSIVVMVVVLIGLAVFLAVSARKRLRQGSDS